MDSRLQQLIDTSKHEEDRRTLSRVRLVENASSIVVEIASDRHTLLIHNTKMHGEKWTSEKLVSCKTCNEREREVIAMRNARGPIVPQRRFNSSLFNERWKCFE